MSRDNSVRVAVQYLPERIPKLLRVISVGRDEVGIIGTFAFIGESDAPGNLLVEP